MLLTVSVEEQLLACDGIMQFNYKINVTVISNGY